MQQPPILEFTILLSLLASVIYGQNLKVDVNLVNVFATVKDDRGNFITDLSKEDFRVYDDDQLQDVRVFEKQDKVDSSIGLLMDASGSMVDIIPYMRRGVRDFTRAISKNDDFFLVSFGTAVKLLHTSKQSVKHLEESLAGLRAWGTSSLYDGLLYSMEKVEKSDRPRKALITFTDGNDNGSNITHARVVQEIQESAVLLYFVAIGSAVLLMRTCWNPSPTSAVAALSTFQNRTRLLPFSRKSAPNSVTNTILATMCPTAPGFIIFASRCRVAT